MFGSNLLLPMNFWQFRFFGLINQSSQHQSNFYDTH